MRQETSPAGLRTWRASLAFLGLWVLAGSSSDLIDVALIWLGLVAAELPPAPSAVWLLGQVALIGLSQAVPQWLVLGRVARHAIWWVPATTLGVLAVLGGPLVAGWFVPGQPVDWWLAVLILVGMYGAVALVQVPVLALTSPRAGWWLLTPLLATGARMTTSIAASVVAMHLGVAYREDLSMARTDPLPIALISIVLGLPEAMVTGLALVWILRGVPVRQPPPEAGGVPEALPSD